MLTILLVAFGLTPSHAFSCKPEEFKAYCDDVNAKDKANPKQAPIVGPDGKPLVPSKDSLKNQDKIYKARRKQKEFYSADEQARLDRILNRTKENAEKVITGGRDYDTLSAEEKNIVDRIRAMKWGDHKNDKAARTLCQDKKAYYGNDPMTGKLYMCPVMLDYSDEALIHITATFMGSLVTDCALLVPQGKIAAFEKPTDKNSAPALNLDRHPFNMSCKDGKCESGRGPSACLLRDDRIQKPSDPDWGQHRASRSMGELVDLTPEAVWRKVLPPTNEELSDDILSGSMSMASYRRRRQFLIDNYISKNPECYPSMTGSQTHSAKIDWFGAEVLAKAMEVPRITSGHKHDHLLPVSAVLDFTCRYDDAAELSAEYGHVDPAKRWDATVMKSTGLRNALNCRRDVSAEATCKMETPRAITAPAQAPQAVPAQSVDKRESVD